MSRLSHWKQMSPSPVSTSSLHFNSTFQLSTFGCISFLEKRMQLTHGNIWRVESQKFSLEADVILQTVIHSETKNFSNLDKEVHLLQCKSVKLTRELTLRL